MFDSRYWLWLSLVFETGTPLCDSLLYAFNHNPRSIYEADKAELAPFCKGNELILSRLTDKRLDKVYAILDFCQRENIGILTPDSRNFPSSLLKISSQPLVLYYKGRLPDFSRRLCVSAVGTRSVTPYGVNAAYTISHDLASMGVTVVSGMALGADTAAHRGALDAGGHTVAFLGCGIDIIYPKDNARLMQEIILHGTVMTEYAPGLPPEGRHFPIRNRLISGVSSAVLVVEAAEKSGALITASHGLKQGKLIYAVPGRVGELSGTGTNLLIRNGAKMVTSAKDIVSDFAGLYEFGYTERHSPIAPQGSATGNGNFKRNSDNASENFHGVDAKNADSPLKSDVKTVKNEPDAELRGEEDEASAAQPRPKVLYNGMTEEETAASYMSIETEISAKANDEIQSETTGEPEDDRKIYLTYPIEEMPEIGYKLNFSKRRLEALGILEKTGFLSEFYDGGRIYSIAAYGDKTIPYAEQRPKKEKPDSNLRTVGESKEKIHEEKSKIKNSKSTVSDTEKLNLEGLNEDEAAVLKFVSQHQPVGIDGMTELQLPVPKLLSTVTVLEIKQRLKQLPGGYFEIKK